MHEPKIELDSSLCCETNSNPATFGNQYYGWFKIIVHPGYGDGTTTYTFSDNLHQNVLQQPGVLIPAVPEPGSMLALGSGLPALAGSVIRRRR